MKTFKVTFEITLNGEYQIEARSAAEAHKQARDYVGDGIGFRDTELVDYEISDIKEIK